MVRTKFEWNYKAAGDLMLRSQEIANVCDAEAERMTRAAGVAYVSDVKMGSQRVSAAARTNDTGQAGVSDSRDGTQVRGYWRKGKDGKKIFVQGYRRRK